MKVVVFVSLALLALVPSILAQTIVGPPGGMGDTCSQAAPCGAPLQCMGGYCVMLCQSLADCPPPLICDSTYNVCNVNTTTTTTTTSSGGNDGFSPCDATHPCSAPLVCAPLLNYCLPQSYLDALAGSGLIGFVDTTAGLINWGGFIRSQQPGAPATWYANCGPQTACASGLSCLNFLGFLQNPAATLGDGATFTMGGIGPEILGPIIYLFPALFNQTMCFPSQNAPCSPECGSTAVCQFGQCRPLPGAPCSPACSTGSQCVFGQCIQLPSGSASCDNVMCPTGSSCLAGQCIYSGACSPACQPGSRCDLGVCRPIPACSTPCTAGQTCTIVPGGDSVCFGAPAATCSPSCSVGRTCYRGMCVPCPVCGNFTATASSAIDSFVNAGVDPSSFTSFQDRAPSTSVQDVPTGGFFRFNGASQLPALNFGSGQAGVQIADQLQATVIALTNGASQGIMNVGAAGRVTAGLLNISAGAELTLGTVAGAIADLTSVELHGNLVISGAGRVNFPAAPADAMTGPTSAPPTVAVAGGAFLSGNLGNAILSLRSNAGVAGEARVPPSSTLNIRGPISGDGTLTVEGNAVFSGPNIDAIVQLNGGVLRINSVAVNGGDIRMNASATIEISSNGNAVQFDKISSCPAGANVILRVAGSFAAGTVPTTGTVFKYGAGTYVNIAALRCNVIVEDSTGVRALSVEPTARRLLTASTANSNWGTSSLSYSITTPDDEEDPFNFGGAASVVPSAVAFVLASIAALVARF